MRYEDASQISTDVTARDDMEHLAGNDFGPATGNLITGTGTVSGATGTDSGGSITAIAGAGGSDDSFDGNGMLEVAGQYGTLTIDAQGNYTYVRAPGSPEGVNDTFTYTLANEAGATDTAELVIAIGNPPILQAQGTQTILQNGNVVTLPPGVELSDVRVVGRDLVITLPDGSTMVIPDGAVFVPQLVVNGVEVPASNLAALLIDAEPRPAAGDAAPAQQSGGGNFALPPGPLDPGVPLGDLLPPTELDYTPPEVEELFDNLDEETEAGVVSVQLDDDVIPGADGNPGGVDDDAPDTVGQNVVSGFLPGSGGDGSLQWALLETGAPAGFTYDLQPDGSVEVTQVQDGNPVLVLTITVNADTGAFEVTQENPIRHASGNNENNTSFVISYTVSDSDDDVSVGQLNINVDDDTPVVTVEAGDDSEVILTTDDADTIGDASDTDVTTADFSGVFTGTSVSPGADGAGSGTTGGYSLAVTSATSGLKSHGADINLYMVGDVVVGATGTQPADLNDADIVFTVEVDSDGVVTLTQHQQIDHADEAPGDTDAPFNDQFASLADGLITLTRSETVVDNDNDSVTGSETVNIGANLHFTDDGPSLDGARAGSSVVVDETDGEEPVSAGDPIVVTSDDPMIVPIGEDYGADGQGPDPVYGLSLLGGVDSIASGLATADGDHPITLNLTSSTLITATYDDGSGTHTAFTIAMNADGTVTVTQHTALEHLIDGPTPAEHDDSLNLTTEINEQTVSLVNATVTIEDFDGDTATEDAPIGNAIIFKDDGPSIEIAVEGEAEVELITDDAGTEGSGSTEDSTTADFSGVFSIAASSGGGDGTASTSLISYSLATAGGASGLSSHGVAINLYMVGDVVVGATGAQPADLSDADIVFTVEVDGDGIVTLTQLQQIDHPAVDDPDGTDAPFNDHVISMLDSLITLTAEATITDNDGDTASDSETIDIAANLTFRDDGPTAPEVEVNSSVELDETDGAEPVSAGAPIEVTSTDPIIAPVGAVDYGADGEGPDPVYGLTLVNGATIGTTIASGLATADGDLPITLELTSSTLITGTYNGGADTAFTIEMNADGTITVTQHTALEHLEDGPPGPDHDDALDLVNGESNLVNATVTYEDFDGDTATASEPIGGAITFRDDGPSITIRSDGEAEIELITDDEGTEGSGSTEDSTTADFSGVFSIAASSGGGDGTASTSLISYSLATAGGASGLSSHGVAINLYMVGDVVVGATGAQPADLSDADIVFTVEVDGDGIVTLTQLQQIDHPAVDDPDGTDAPFNDHVISMLDDSLITLTAEATITDNDGDTASDSETIDIAANLTFRDDGPTVSNPEVNSSVLLDETDGDEPLSSGDPISDTSNAAVITADIDYGADGEGPDPVYGLTLVNGATIGTTIASGLATADGDLPITLELTSSTLITGTYNGGADTAFTIQMNANGSITVTQHTALEHLIDGPTPADHDDALDLIDAQLQNLVNATVTYEDFDGDTATASVAIGGAIVFEDDGPTAVDDGSFGTFDDGVANENIGNVSTLLADDSFGGDGAAATDSITIAVGSLGGTITIDGSGDMFYTSNHDAAPGDSDVETFTYTITDADGDTDTATFTVTLTDDGPVIGTTEIAVDEEGLDDGLAGTVYDDGSDLAGELETQSGFLTGLDFGGDGVGDIVLTAVADTGLRTLSNQVVKSHWDGASHTLTGFVDLDSNGLDAGDIPVFTLQITDVATGAYTFTLLEPVKHDTADTEDNETFSVSVTVTDSEGDPAPAPGTINILIDDDSPDVEAVVNNDAAVELDETLPSDAATITLVNGITAGNDPDLDGGLAIGRDVSAESVLTLTTEEYGADGPAANPDDAVYSLSVDNPSSGLSTTEGDPIDLVVQQDGTVVVGVVQGTSTAAFAIQIDPETGVITVEQYLSLDHPVAGTSAAAHNDPLSMTAGHISANITIEDGDGDTDSDTGIDISGLITFRDDGPAVTVTAAVQPNLVVDESDLTIDAGPTDFSGLFDVDFGADGPASSDALDFELNINPGSTGLVDTATGEDIILVKVGETIEGRTDTTNELSFVISVNADGEVSLDQKRAVVHDDENDPNDVEIFDSDSLITLSLTAKDGDGDEHTNVTPVNIAQNFQFFDDGPTIDTETVTDPLEIENTGSTPSGTGNFDFDVGADTNSDNDDISVSPVGVNGFKVSINGTPATNVQLFPDQDENGDPLPEDADTASYRFTFEYDTGTGGTAEGEGMLVFDKSDGSYTVTLLSGPIEGFSILETGNEQTDFVEYDIFGTGSPDVVTAQLTLPEAENQLFAQFTAFARPNAQGNHITTVDPEPGGDQEWTPGDLFTADVGGPQVSESDAGVDGNTMDTGEILDFDLFTSDPGSDTGLTPDGVATEMFIQFFQYSGDDIIVVLKLQDADNPGVTTTRAIMVDQNDVFTDADTATGTAYAGLVAGLGSQDALVVIQSNDYNAVGENWVIVGAQIVTDEDGTTGEAINLNPDLHDPEGDPLSGSSDRDGDGFFTNDADPDLDEIQSFTDDTDVSGLKITSIGFLVPDSTDQQATIEFDVTITDGDGDSVTYEDVTVNIGGEPPVEELSATTMMSSKESFSGDETSSFSLLSSSNDTQQLEKTAANSNNVVLAAAIGAAGFAAGSVAAQTPSFDTGDTYVTNALVGRQSFADFTASEIGGGKFTAFDAFQDSGFEFGAMSLASTSHQAMAASHIGELTTSFSLGSGPNALLEATDFGAMLHMQAPAMGMDVAMVAADALMPQVTGVNAQTTGAVEQILADALQGGGAAADIDALLNALPGGGLGDNAGLRGLATQAGDHVPTWDMGHGGVFTFDAASIITMEAMTLHHDAVQPVANG